jgi:hypothetical protein
VVSVIWKKNTVLNNSRIYNSRKLGCNSSRDPFPLCQYPYIYGVVVFDFEGDKPLQFFVSTTSEYVPVIKCEYADEWIADLSEAITRLGINYLYAADDKTLQLLVRLDLAGVRFIKKVFNMQFVCFL